MLKALIPASIQMLIVNRQILRDLDNWRSDDAYADIRALSEDQLKEYLASEWVRAKELDEKLIKLTAALSVATTVGGVLAKTISDGLAPTGFKFLVIAILLLSMIMFSFGAWIGFNGLRPKMRFGYGAEFLKSVGPGSELGRRKSEYQEALSGFQATNLVRANEASAAIATIRNGILLFALATVISIFAPNVSKTNMPAPQISVPASSIQN